MQVYSSYDFSQPQQLHIRSFWLKVTQSLWVIGKNFIPLLLLMLVKKSNGTEKWWFVAIPFMLLIFSFFRAYIQYKFFQFTVQNGELVLTEGWLNKKQTILTLDKIHEVNLNQNFLHKLLGLYHVSIDTAGSSQTEIEINGISHRRALALKEFLTQVDVMENKPLVEEISSKKDAIQQRIHISTSSLIKIGLTRNYLQTFGVFLAFGYQIIDQIEPFFYNSEESIYDDILSTTTQVQTGLVWLGILFFFMIFIIIFNLVRTFITYYNFQIQLKNEHVVLSYGLTNSHLISVPSHKVQLFQFQQNYFQKWMNLFEVKVKQVESEHANKKKKGIIIPGANYLELQNLFRVIYSKNLIDIPHYYRPHIRLFVIKTTVVSLLFLLLMSIAWYFDEKQFIFMLPILLLMVIGMMYKGYLNTKMYYDNEFLVFTNGVWDVTTTYLHISKVQQISISQSIFQRKKQIGSLTLSTAGGGLSLRYYSFPVLQQLTNEWTFQIEKKRYKWT